VSVLVDIGRQSIANALFDVRIRFARGVRFLVLRVSCVPDRGIPISEIFALTLAMDRRNPNYQAGIHNSTIYMFCKSRAGRELGMNGVQDLNDIVMVANKTAWSLVQMGILLLVPLYVEAGWVVTEKTDYSSGYTIGQGAHSETTKIYIDKTKIRTDMGKDGWMVVDAAEDMMLMVNPVKRRYYEGSFKAWLSEMKQMVEVIKKYSEESMKGVGDVSDAQPGPIVEEAGSGGVIAGYSTVKYRILERGRLKQEIWIVPLSKLPSEIRKIDHVMKEMMEALNLGVRLSSPLSKGMEMQTREYNEDGSIGVVSRVLGIQKEGLSESLFEPPGGYSRVSSWKELGEDGGSASRLGNMGAVPQNSQGNWSSMNDGENEDDDSPVGEVREGVKNLLEGIGGFFGQ